MSLAPSDNVVHRECDTAFLTRNALRYNVKRLRIRICIQPRISSQYRGREDVPRAAHGAILASKVLLYPILHDRATFIQKSPGLYTVLLQHLIPLLQTGNQF